MCRIGLFYTTLLLAKKIYSDIVQLISRFLSGSWAGSFPMNQIFLGKYNEILTCVDHQVLGVISESQPNNSVIPCANIRNLGIYFIIHILFL
jgi:hypothetical protein